MSELKVYRNSVIEWVVARSPEDATAVLMQSGYGSDNPDENDSDWEECPPDKAWTMDDDGTKTTRTFAEWASINGRGFLGTTEY